MSDSDESLENQTSSIENIDTNNIKTDSEQKSRFKFPQIKLPKWATITLMIVPSLILITVILLVDLYVGFPETINPISILALTGLVLVGFVVISDMVYRNIYSYRIVRRESAKSKIYKEIIQEKKKQKEDKAKYDYLEEDEELDDEYIYEDDEEEVEEGPDDFIEDEYQYDMIPPDTTEEDYYRIKSLIFRGGLFSILIVNGLILLIAAAILQLTYGGGFSTSDNSTST